MVDLKIIINYEVWKDRSITKLSKVMLVSVETDTDTVKGLKEQIKYLTFDIYEDSTVHNAKVKIIDIHKGKLDNFTLDELTKLEILL
jgi:hypothetical protein